MPLVSAIIPAYNCSQYIAETITSILSQNAAPDIEVIVVNDGSTDDTADVARSFGDPVRVIDQPNAGVSAARNHGLRKANGAFLAFVDHDDYWMPNKLAHQLACFETHRQVGVVFTDFFRWYPEDGKYPSPASLESETDQQGIDDDMSGWIYHQMLLDSWVLTSTALARSEVIVSAHGFDEALPFSEDWDLWLRISRECQFIKLKERSTLYRQHVGQGSRVVRRLDYRTRLLEEAEGKWGLMSRDGRSITRRQFSRQLSKYSVSFGLEHLKDVEGASRLVAARAFVKAWAIDPSQWNSLIYLLAMVVGWKPKWQNDSLPRIAADASMERDRR